MSTASLLLFAAMTLAVIATLGIMHARQERRWREFEKRHPDAPALSVITQWLQDMRGSLERSTAVMQQQMQATQRSIAERLDAAAQALSMVHHDLGQMQEIGRQMREFQDFFRSPKLRGNIGEQVLRELLEQVLPRACFRLQHRFANGQVVDAVIVSDKGLIPIDAKFPLEDYRQMRAARSEDERAVFARNFVRTIRRHIDTISEKYIAPAEGTVDFALMYVPSEVVYYEIIAGDYSLLAHAQQRRVVVVSPNSFYLFLHVVLMGLEGQRIEETARRILQALDALRHDAGRLGEGLRLLNTHVNNARAALERVNNDFALLTSKIEGMRQLRPGEDHAQAKLPGEGV
ncbi:MAG: DNA recombination protein RmuC [bacterium]|jgi:DNA recombination protein RmuC|nr:DNA recombination protein RmuC [candidate division KSB1 bacterium]MDH7559097.1 DNA recombination protein RmuC [bacterium]